MQRDVEKVEEIYGAWGKRDLTSILLRMAQDVEVVPSPELPWGGEYSGHDGMRQFFAVWAEHLDSRLLLERLIDAGDQVVAVGRQRCSTSAAT
jgi:ketosteroid isomerase-like protein